MSNTIAAAGNTRYPLTQTTLDGVVVTGIGVILPGCDNRETFWQHVSQGDSQLSLEPDPSDPERLVPMGRIRDFDARRYLSEFNERYFSRCSRAQQLFLASVMQALKDARLSPSAVANRRAGLFDGTARDSFGYWHERVRSESMRVPGEGRYTRDDLVGLPGQAANIAAAMLGVRGPAYTFNGTCSAGAIAVGHAFRELQLGLIDIALASGHDAPLLGPVYETYKEAALLCLDDDDPRRAMRPYVGHSRNVFAEGSVTLVLEREGHARARGATVLARLSGYEYGNTGRHPTDVDHTGERPAELIEQVLENAGLGVDQVRFVVGHGNAAPKSDVAELEYMRRVFGERTRNVPLISVKPIFGHAMGCSSAMGIAAGTLMLHHRYIVPTINIDESLVTPGFNHQANRGRPDPCGAGVIVNFGIGGQNTVVLVERVDGGAGAAS